MNLFANIVPMEMKKEFYLAGLEIQGLRGDSFQIIIFPAKKSCANCNNASF
jgi:hypothetical protein